MLCPRRKLKVVNWRNSFAMHDLRKASRILVFLKFGMEKVIAQIIRLNLQLLLKPQTGAVFTMQLKNRNQTSQFLFTYFQLHIPNANRMIILLLQTMG